MQNGYLYKLNVNGTESDETRDYQSVSDRWSKIADTLEGRGGNAKWMRRAICSNDIIRLLTRPEKWMVIGENAIGPWEIFAELNL